MTDSQGKKQSTVANPKITQMLDLTVRNFKALLLYPCGKDNLKLMGRQKFSAKKQKLLKKKKHTHTNFGIKGYNIRNFKNITGWAQWLNAEQ